MEMANAYKPGGQNCLDDRKTGVIASSPMLHHNAISTTDTEANDSNSA